jgi:calcineurin-like phosphoesterase
VVNGENASGVGLTPQQAERIYDAGADVITLGNHTFGRLQIADFLDDAPYILRPANYTGAPGRGWGLYDRGAVTVRVVNLIGRCGLNFNADNPFLTMDRSFKKGTGRPLPWWIFTPRPPAKSWPWATIWTDV